jgi:hypothetical protein
MGKWQKKFQLPVKSVNDLRSRQHVQAFTAELFRLNKVASGNLKNRIQYTRSRPRILSVKTLPVKGLTLQKSYFKGQPQEPPQG